MVLSTLRVRMVHLGLKWPLTLNLKTVLCSLTNEWQNNILWLIKFNTHHPEERSVSQGLVLFDGRQDAEDQTGQNYEEPVGESRTNIIHPSIHDLLLLGGWVVALPIDPGGYWGVPRPDGQCSSLQWVLGLPRGLLPVDVPRTLQSKAPRGNPNQMPEPP